MWLICRKRTGLNNTHGRCLRPCHICYALVTEGWFIVCCFSNLITFSHKNSYYINALLQVSSTITDRYVAYYALYDIWSNMLCTFLRTCDQFNSKFGQQSSAISWTGNLLYQFFFSFWFSSVSMCFFNSINFNML